MRGFVTFIMVAGFIFGCSSNLLEADEAKYRRLPVKQYDDRMKAGWVGQMAGVGWGGPTEFRWRGQIIPEDKMPKWKLELINQFVQDDIYVEMTFLRTLELYGFDVSIRQAGIDFASSGYELWHANQAGRKNLRSGIAPPDSGHPQFNKHADDIDYQIEADFSGLIAPGLPNVAIRPAVVNRKVFGGNRTKAGAHAQEVLASVFLTCAQRGQDALTYLAKLICFRPECRLPFVHSLLPTR